MRSIARLAACFAVLLLWEAPPAIAAGPCEGRRAISVPLVSQQDGLVSVVVAIDRRPAKLIVDTGGSFGMMEQGAVRKLGLPVETRGRSIGSVIGRIGIDEIAHTGTLQVGNLPPAEEDFAVVPPGLIGDGADGTLAGDYLSSFDVDLDFAAKTLSLLPRGACGPPPERIQSRVAAMLHDRGHHVLIPARLGDANLIAVLDTGAAKSAIARQVPADLLGLDTSVECQKSDAYTSVNGGAARASPPHEFDFLDVAGWRIPHPRIEFLCAQPDSRRGPQLILGMDLLQRFRIRISYADDRVYLSAAEPAAHL